MARTRYPLACAECEILDDAGIVGDHCRTYPPNSFRHCGGKLRRLNADERFSQDLMRLQDTAARIAGSLEGLPAFDYADAVYDRLVEALDEHELEMYA